ncbi:MAG: hypothetical protein ACLGHN_14730 [Bacteriovoracia bacterium]
MEELLFAPIDCFPHCGCEQTTFLIRQPVAVASSLAYFFVGFLLLKKANKSGVSHRGWPFLIFLIGTTSILAHSSFTKIAMAMDFTSIILLITYFPMLDVLKLKGVRQIPSYVSFPLYYILLIGLLLPFTMLQQYFIAMIMFFFSVAHLIKEKTLSVLYDKRLIFSLAVIGFSLVFMFIDKHEFFCGIRYMPYGHTIWHCGSAVGIYLFGKWYFFESAKLHDEVERDSN